MFGLFGKKRSPEETIERQGGASHHGKPGETIRITGGISGSGLYGVESNFPGNRDFRVSENGRLVIQPGVEEYYWNDRLKRYDAMPGRGRGYLLAENIKAEEDEEENVGGGSSTQTNTKKPKGKGKTVNVGTPGGTTIPGTYDPGSSGSGLLAISPGAVNWSPQVGVLNPLADPNNFYIDLPTIQLPQDQRYINPNLGVLV